MKVINTSSKAEVSQSEAKWDTEDSHNIDLSLYLFHFLMYVKNIVIV